MNPSPQTLLDRHDQVGILELVAGRTYYLLRMGYVSKVRYDGSDDRHTQPGVGPLCFAILPEETLPNVRSINKLRLQRLNYRNHYQAFEIEERTNAVPKRSRPVTQLEEE